MEGGDILGASGSAIWRSNAAAMEPFSRSSREGEEEEALRWAALERLPTYQRLRKGIFTTSHGATEIEIDNLGFAERKNLFKRLLNVVEEDNESFLLKLRNRLDRVGIDLPTIQVRFENLNVEAKAHVGSRALPSFLNFFVGIVEDFLNYLHILPSRKKPFTILRDVSGIIEPSRMALLLGPPSSGKTTLLLALAGKLDPDLKFSGRVTYNGHDMHEFIPQRTAAYISQHDLHIAEMTVRETFEFSARCQGVGSRYDMLAELSRREKASNIKPDPDIDLIMKATSTEGREAIVMTDYILKVLGLEGCADTMVGNDMLRGISGGQKKRVTTGELLVGPANVLLMDEISTGLDSSTTFQIVKSLKQFIHILNETAVISLLQPAPETFNLFDDIILLSDSQIVYQGPREHVLDFFESVGFKCPERKGVADFLQEVTSKKDQEQYWSREDDTYHFVTAKEFADAFKLFHVGKTLGEKLATPFDKAKSHPAALTTRKYGVGKKELLKISTSRTYLLMKRNAFVYLFKLFQITMMAIITMTMFLRTKMHRNSVTEGTIYAGAMFFAVTMVLFNGMAEISMTIAKLPVFYKQRDLLFYPSWAYAIPTWILNIPIGIVEVAVWVFMTYYVIGFDPNVARFLKQFLLLILVQQMATGLYRLVAATSRNMTISYTGGCFVLLVLFVLSGFILPRGYIKKWWKWGYWSSPMMYAQSGMVVNEFLGHHWKHVLPSMSEPLGLAVLRSHDFFIHGYWYWIGAGALVGFTVLFNFCFIMALHFLNPYEKPQAFISEESEREEQHGRPGQPINLSSRGNSSTHGNSTEIAVRASESNKRGMVLPFQPHSLTFDDITYSVDMPQEMKTQGIVEDKLVLLKGVSGAFRPGVLTALMGVSGAGKTTLMDVLAGRKTGGYIEGTIKISGYPKKQETFARVSGYCEQNDIHSPYVTVYESLLYSAWLRLPHEVNTETRKMFIEEVMELVELNPIRNALVGFPGVNGLSTEQRKRLTIAVELVANPSIIFMDEPTSGLDARAAAIVMRTVRNTVDTGRTVVCTIHQPSIDIFEAFDELFLLKRGGQEIYVGPLGRRSCHLIKYFEGIKGVSKIKDDYNPATWMLEVSSSSQELALGIDFSEIYKNSELRRRNKSLIEELSTPPPGSKDLYFPTMYSQPFVTQFIACLWKQHWSFWRNSSYTAVRLLFAVIIALLIGSMFWDLGSKTSRTQNLFNAMGSMYTASLFLGFQNGTSVQPIVSVERTVFYREKAAGMYSSMAYALAQVVIELPYIFVQALMYCVLVYAMIGFEWTAAKFFWYIFFMYFTLLYFTYYGLMCVALTPNYHIASIACFTCYALWNLFCGYLIPRPMMPKWWRWFYWTCPISWTLYGLVGSQYGDLEDVFSDSGVAVKEFLDDYLGFKHDFLGVVAVVIVGFPVLYAFTFAVAIKVLNFQNR